MTDPLKLALDRFDVPPLSEGLADRIAAAVGTPTRAPVAPSRRDRRGMWRRGRQVVLGTLAVGLLSAGAVASGFLSRVGIEVPVLTAMLAPKLKPVAKPAHLTPKLPVTRSAVAVPPEATTDSAPAGIARPLFPEERMALREERRERRQVFAAEHPVAAAVIRERVREQLQRRALARRQAMLTPGVDAALPGAGHLGLADRAALARAARRDRVLAEKMIDRRIHAREARIAERKGADGAPIGGPIVMPSATPTDPRPLLTGEATQRPFANGLPQRIQQITPEERAARRARFQQMAPGERTQLRERLQQRRALRAGRARLNPAQN
jgi:hypothetical protein